MSEFRIDGIDFLDVTAYQDRMAQSLSRCVIPSASTISVFFDAGPDSVSHIFRVKDGLRIDLEVWCVMQDTGILFSAHPLLGLHVTLGHGAYVVQTRYERDMANL